MVEMGRTRQRRRWWLWLLAVLALLAGAYLLFQPRVLSTTPQDGTSAVAPSTPVEIQFNRPMITGSVEARLEFSPETSGHFDWQGNRVRFTPDNAWPEGETVEVRLRAGARSALSLPVLTSHSWRFGVSQPSVVYLIGQASQARLERRVLNELEPQVLVEAVAGVIDYEVVPEQASLITVEGQNDGSSLINWRELSGQFVRELVRCAADQSCRHPALSADGQWLAWQQRSVQRSSTGVLETGPWQVAVKQLDPAEAPLFLGPGGETHSPQWVPDARLALYSEELESLLLYQRVASGWQQLASVEHQLGEQWTWSPDGRFVIFPEVVLLEPTSSGISFFSHLIRVEAESGLSTDLSGTVQNRVEDASPAYSPDGLRIAFARKSLEPAEWSLGRQLFMMTADGSEARPLSNEPNFNHASIRWHPDGNRLLYVSFNQAILDPATEIWWYDLTTDQASLVVEGGFEPEWMP